MKLPKKIMEEVDSIKSFPLSPLLERELAFELIVRDCAKVCIDVGPKTGALTLISIGFSKAILDRYGLTEESPHTGS